MGGGRLRPGGKVVGASILQVAGHVLEVGTYIGKNWGKVTLVTSKEVIVTEEYQTLDGELVVNNHSLTLPIGDDAALVQ